MPKEKLSTPKYSTRFQRRARAHYFLSWFLLLLIFCLLGAGAYVYQKAPQITQVDISKASRNIEVLNKEIEILYNSAKSARRALVGNFADFEAGVKDPKDLISTFDNYVSIYSEYLTTVKEFNVRAKNFQPGSEELLVLEWTYYQDMVYMLQDAQSKTRSALSLIEAWLEEGTGNVTSTSLFDMQILDGKVKKLLLNSESKLKGMEEKGKKLNLKPMKRLAPEPLPDKADLAYASQAIANSTVESTSKEKNNDIVPLVQTNITRFGTLLVVFFFISILVPIYRYTVQLAAFYNAIADTLILKQETLSDDFDQLSKTLTPSIPFGKSPQTPNEQVLELLRATLLANVERKVK